MLFPATPKFSLFVLFNLLNSNNTVLGSEYCNYFIRDYERPSYGGARDHRSHPFSVGTLL